MMAYERSESAWDNFGKFTHQVQPETNTLIRKLERNLIKSYRQNVSLLFNQTGLNERLLSSCSIETRGQVHLPRKQCLINRERHQHTTSKGIDSY